MDTETTTAKFKAVFDGLSKPQREKLATAAGCSIGHLRNVGYGLRDITTEIAAATELVTLGQVTAEQLKPDSRWARVRDKSWPHPKGRPTHDVVTA